MGFIEFLPYIGQCKFSNCRHTREPGCAVTLAVQAGKFIANDWIFIIDCCDMKASIQTSKEMLNNSLPW